MAVELTLEQVSVTSDRLADAVSIAYEDVSTSHEYELNQSESLTFLYNLLYDDKSLLSKTDILSILNSLKERENNLPFSFTQLDGNMNVQGVRLTPSLRRKFYLERFRIGSFSWFSNVPNSREDAMTAVTLASYHTKTDFFRFKSFYSRLKNHITHFQLRLLVVCGDNVANGVFYPSSFFHDNNLEVVTESHNLSDDYHSFFKINRLMPDDQAPTLTMKLDCVLDSRSLKFNSNSRISSSACSSKFLANGTFEGGYILHNIESPDNTYLVGEYMLTDSSDGITNHITIRDDSELIVASNDASLRVVDLCSGKKSEMNLPFAINCLAVNPTNCNEYFVAADDIHNYIVDRRTHNDHISFSGHKDYGFGCDWCPSDANILLSGNQDGTVRLWDRRMPDESIFSWSSALGSESFDIDRLLGGGPVRNCRFSYHGKHVVWAESLDHVGVIHMNDLRSDCDLVHSRVQSIDFIGKCIGLNMCPQDSGYGEQLVIGINDCPLGGILNYQLEATDKPLDFDFTF